MNQSSSVAHEVGAITVLIADDHAMVRTGLCMILEDEPDIEVVGEAKDGAAALKLASTLLPTIVLADISMPPPDGIELARLLCRELPGIRTIVVSMHEDPRMLRAALQAGAVGYVVKRSSSDELVRAIRAAAAGEVYVDQRMR
jgi:DNA-binding NarL/FixJ family response regulator